MDDDDLDKQRALDAAADDEQIGRFSDAFVSDFDGTSALILSALEKDTDSPTVLIETLTEILRHSETCLPAATSDRFESELIPQVVQIVLRKSEHASMGMESVECLADFLESVLERVAHRLLYCDPCLLPTLVRILDEQRVFYANRLDNTAGESSPFVNGEASRVSPLYLRIVSHWGAVDGFTILLRCLQASGARPESTDEDDDDDEKDLPTTNEQDDDASDVSVFPFDAIQCIYRSLYAVKDHLSHELLKQYVGPLAQSSRMYVASMTEREVASVPRDKLLEVVHIVELVVAQVSHEITAREDQDETDVAALEEAELCVQLLQLDVMLRFFTSRSLEKRIYGLVEMIDVLNKASTANYLDLYHKWIHENQLVGLLFGEKKHPELIKRALPLLRFVFANAETLTDDWLDAMWVCFAGKSCDLTKTPSTGSHEIVRVTVHALLLEVIGFAHHELLEQLMARIRASSRPLDGDVLALVASVAKRTSSLRQPALLYIWTKLPSSTSSAIVDQGIEDMVAVLGLGLDDSEIQALDAFVRLCVKSINSATTHLSVALRLLEKIASVVNSRQVHVAPAVASTVVPAILAEMNLFEQRSKQTSHDTLASVATDAEAHVHGVRERLLALRGGMVIAQVSLTPVRMLEVVDAVWDLCVSTTYHDDDSASLFFQWIEYCFRTKIVAAVEGASSESESSRLLGERLAEQLLHQRFASLDGETMTMSALACFHHLFRQVNIAHSGIVVHDGEVDEETETDDTDAATRFSDLLTGKKLVGMEALWRFALHAADQAVAEEAMTLLARYHMDVVPTLVGSKFAYAKKRAFIAKCTSHLRAGGVDSDSAITCRAEKLVRRCLDCLRYFLEANQAGIEIADGGSAQTKDLSPRTVDADGLNKFALENLEEKLQLLDVYPSPMKDSPFIPSGSISTDASAPVMLYNGPRRPSWNFKQHHAVLEAIQDECDTDTCESEKDTVCEDKCNGEHPLEMPLAERRLSIDTSVSGPALRPTQLTTSPSVRARPNLQWFQASHGSSPSQEPEFVLQDLEGADYTTAGEPDVSNMESPVPVAQLLVNWPKLFDTLIELVHWKDAATSQRAWGLLCQLPINAEILKCMLRLRPAPNDDVSWPQLLDASRPHRLLYALRLIEALLLPWQQKKQSTNQSDDKVRRQWRERFLRLGGAQHVKHLLSTLRSRNDDDDESSIELSCIGALARILTYVARLHDAPTDWIDPASPFDTRLCHATLSQAFPLCGDQIESIFTLVAERLRPKTPGRKDTRSEATTLCIIELFCCLVPLNPTLALHDRIRNSVRDLLETVFLTLESKNTRQKVIQLMVDMEHKFASRVASREFYETVLTAAFEMSDDGKHAEDELLELLVAMSTHLSTLSDWIMERSIVPDILAKVESLADTDSCSETSTSLACHLRLVAAMASLPGPLQDACLRFQPPGASVAAELPWLLDLVVQRILWTASDKSMMIDDPATRKAAQDIIMSLVFSSQSRLDTYGSSVLRQLSSYYQTVHSRLTRMGRPWNLRPSDELQDRSTNGIRFAGLVNPGCVCYMNSLMQQLFMMPAFRNGLLMLDASTSSSASNECQNEITELQKLFVGLTASERKALDPTDFALSHRDMDGQPTDLNLQMDADEFFCLLLDRVETCVLSSSPAKDTATPSTFLDQCFGGVLVNQILTEHGHLSEREEKFFALSLDISQKQQLPESLSLYVQGETLDGDNAYFCEHANKKVSATKRVCIKTLPQTLVCHLKRFEFDFDTMQKIKIHDYLAFPEEIDMYPYTSQAFATTPSSDDDASGLPIMYDLVGIVVHSGSSDMGHYYSFIKDRAATSQDASRWFEFNDQTVKPLDVATMGDECFGGEEVTQKWDHGSRAYVPVVQRKRRSAYMLVYERREASVETKDQSSKAIDWTITPLSVQLHHQVVAGENQEMRHLVNVVTQDHVEFLQKVLDASVTNTGKNENPVAIDTDGGQETDDRTVEQQIAQMEAADIHMAVLSCQHVFGVSSLLQCDDESAIGTLLGRIEEWLKDPVETKTDRKLLFCNWLLGQATVTAISTAQSDRVTLKRSWLLDVLLFCDKRPLFVRTCCSLLLHTLQFLVAHAHTFQDRRAAIEFLRYIGELFYERHDVVIDDPASGTGFSVPQATIVHGVTLLGAFLKDCITSDDEVNRIKELLLTKAGFIDRFLFSLQTNEPSRRSEASSMAPLTSRERSCTFSLERKLLTDAFAALPMLRDNVLKDSRLLMNHSVLKNIVAFDFTEVVTPLIAYTVRHQLTRGQGEKLVSLLLAVLEEVKTTHLDQLLHVFGALLDAGIQADHSGGLTSIHENIFSPSSGLLEAAAYYRDHRTLHEYAFLLVEFVVTRADASPRLQRYFQNDEDIAGQVEWIKHWLGNYLDPRGTIRHGSEKQNKDHDESPSETNDQQEDPTLETEVRLIFKKAERAFGFAMLQTHTSGHDDHDDDAHLEDKSFAIESLEDSDGLLFSSDGENQDDDDDADAVLEQPLSKNSTTAKRVPHHGDWSPSLEPNTSRVDPNKSERGRPEVDEEASSSSTIVTRAHMSSAA